MAHPVGRRVSAPLAQRNRQSGGSADHLARSNQAPAGASDARILRFAAHSGCAGDGTGPPARPPKRPEMGGVAGAVVGFFGSFIAFAAVMFSRRPGPGQSPLVFAFFPVVVGGLVVGIVAGIRLGGWLADRGYRPTPGGSPGRPMNRGWVFAGAMVGWMLGFPIGMGLTMVLTRQIQARWMMPITFFTPALVCLLLGGFAGYRVARVRADRRTGG